MRNFAFLAFVVIFIFVCAIPLHADDTALFTIQVSPDALIALDLSGSMGANPGGDYNYQVSYVGSSDDPCTDTGTWPTYHPGLYQCASDGYIYADYACNGPFYKTSSGSHTTDCSKLAIAKRAIFDLLDDNNDGSLTKGDETSLNARIGYMRFQGAWREDTSLNYGATGAKCDYDNYPNDVNCNTLKRGFDFSYKSLYDSYIKNETTFSTSWARTPLVTQLKEAKKYLDDHKNGVSPAASTPDPAAACRKKFIILVTDGWDTCACGMDASKGETATGSWSYKRRRATLAAVKPAADAGYRVFIVGFGSDMPQTEANTLEWCAFYGGTDNLSVANSGDTSAITPDSDPCLEYSGCTPSQSGCTNAPNDPGYKTLTGYAYMAPDASRLGKYLKDIIRYILEKSFSYTAPTIPSVRLIDKDVVYISSFIPDDTPFWKGNLKAYQLNSDGTLPTDSYGNPADANLLWDAFDKLKVLSPDDRKIYTYSTTSKQVKEFKVATITKEDVAVPDDLKKSDLVNHVRGYDAFDIDMDSNFTEVRTWKLGDIFHSNAVIVGQPNPFFEDDTEIGYDGKPEYEGAIAAYKGFYNDKKSRKKLIIAGADDGMLHFFDASTGDEVGTFIPPSLLTNLQLMKSSWDQFKATGLPQPHLYYVDGSPKASEVWVPSYSTDKTKSKDEWHTVLVCGLRKGGKTYFALGITNTESTAQGMYPPIGQGFLWEFPSPGKNYNYANVLAKMGQSWSDPAIGRIKIEGADGELYERWVAFIGGGYDATNTTGNSFFVVDIWTGELIKEFSGLTGGAGKTFSMPAPPKAVDVNGDGYVDKVYIGSLGNQMWVFDVSFNAITKKSVSQWSGKILFQAPGAPPNTHPIYTQAAVALDWSSNVWVFFGSGDREDPMGSTCNERFTAIKDDGKGTYPRGINDLENVSTTSKNTFNTPADPPYKGWYIDLAATEKVLAKATVFNGLVYFTTYTPKLVVDACSVAGTAKLYVVDYTSGGGALSVDDLSDFQNPAGDRSKIIGVGIPSDPVISVNLQGKASVIIGTTSNEVYSQKAFSPPSNKQFIYWHEIIP